MDWFSHFIVFWRDAISRTFIVDNRYQIFVDGIKNTLTITVGALLVGVAIGVAVAISKVYYYQVGPYTIMDHPSYCKNNHSSGLTRRHVNFYRPNNSVFTVSAPE